MKTMTDTTKTTTKTTKWPRTMLYDGRLWHWYGLRSSDGRLLLACPDAPARGCRAAESGVEGLDEPAPGDGFPDSQKL